MKNLYIVKIKISYKFLEAESIRVGARHRGREGMGIVGWAQSFHFVR